MRPVLALVLAVVLPLKAVAAVVVPIVGTPHHGHAVGHPVQAATPEAGDGASGHDHAGCPGSSDQSPSGADTLHDHACPHLAMATIVPALPALAASERAPAAVPRTAPPFVSIVLDLPVPPPTRQS